MKKKKIRLSIVDFKFFGIETKTIAWNFSSMISITLIKILRIGMLIFVFTGHFNSKKVCI